MTPDELKAELNYQSRIAAEIQKLKNLCGRVIQNDPKQWMSQLGLPAEVKKLPEQGLIGLIYRQCREIHSWVDSFTFAPVQDIEVCSRHMERVEKLLSAAHNFEAEGGAVALQTAFTDFQRVVIPIYSKAVIEKHQIQAALMTLHAAVEEATDNGATIRRLLEEAQKPATEIELGKQGEVFRSQARRHFCAAMAFLVTAVVVGIVIVCFAVSELGSVEELLLAQQRPTTATGQPATATEAPRSGSLSSLHLEHISLRLIMFSVLFVGLTFVVKNYRAQMHNCVLNRHRAKCMESYRVFLDLNPHAEKETTSAFLRAATTAVFSQASTGYSVDDPSDQSSNQFIEVFKPAKNQE